MKPTVTRELTGVTPHGGKPRYRYTVSDENGATLATTADRETARNIVRKIKTEHKALQS